MFEPSISAVVLCFNIMLFLTSLLHQESSLMPRKAPPCDVEIMALVQLSAVPVLVRLQDGNKVEVMADSWTSVSDLEKQVCSTHTI